MGVAYLESYPRMHKLECSKMDSEKVGKPTVCVLAMATEIQSYWGPSEKLCRTSKKR